MNAATGDCIVSLGTSGVVSAVGLTAPHDPEGIVGPLGAISMGRTKDVVVFHARASAKTKDWKFFLYTLDLTIPGALPVRLVEGVHPAWSPDDTKIVFRDSRDMLSALTLSTMRTTAIAPMGITPDWRQ